MYNECLNTLGSEIASVSEGIHETRNTLPRNSYAREKNQQSRSKITWERRADSTRQTHQPYLHLLVASLRSAPSQVCSTGVHGDVCAVVGFRKRRSVACDSGVRAGTNTRSCKRVMPEPVTIAKGPSAPARRYKQEQSDDGEGGGEARRFVRAWTERACVK